jgi:hypothetical protein
MNGKWLVGGCALLAASLLGLSVWEGAPWPIRQPVAVWQGSGLKQERANGETLDMEQSGNPLQLQPFAHKVGAVLVAPERDHEVTDSLLTVAGRIRGYRSLASRTVWIQVDYLGEKKPELPATVQYYVPIRDGRFEEKIRLFYGKGNYRVTVRLPSDREPGYYYPMVSFTAVNRRPEMERDIMYSEAARREGLKLSAPALGLMVAEHGVQVRGIAPGERKLLLQLRKGEKVWRKELNVRNGRFDEMVPLLYGKGIHEVQVMLPAKDRPDYYVEGATFYVDHSLDETRTPIEFTRLVEERGIRLLEPVAGGETVELKEHFRGEIDPASKDAAKTDYVVVQTKKGNDKATYFLPVRDYRFEGDIWFRFGAGTYEVTLFVPEVTSEHRDFFRFYTVADFQVNSLAKDDLRDLLPGRGIESDNPRIVQLAWEIAGNKKTPRDKAKEVYRYVATHVRYDVDKFRRNTFAWDDSALKTLRTGSGVCQDYAFLSIALLRALDIPSRFVEGTAGGQRHAWVEVWVGNRWLTMDPTWGSGYIRPDGTFVRKYDSHFFDPPPSFFNETHKRTGVMY